MTQRNHGGALSKAPNFEFGDLETAAPGWRLGHWLDRCEVRIFFRERAKGGVHVETDFEMLARFVGIAEERFVATHVVVIDRFFAKNGGPSEQKFARRGRLAELVQTKSAVKETGAAFGSDAAKFSADLISAAPAFALHEMMQAQLQNFRAILQPGLDCL